MPVTNTSSYESVLAEGIDTSAIGLGVDYIKNNV